MSRTQQQQQNGAASARASRVHGISGVRLYARDPQGLSRWYAERLGLDASEQRFVPLDEGRTSWGLLGEEGVEEGSNLASRIVIGYRVEGLEALVRALVEAGENVTGPETLDHGRYAWLRDPEGNPIELFEAGSSESEA